MGFGVWGLGFGVWGLGFRVGSWTLGFSFRVQGLLVFFFFFGFRGLGLHRALVSKPSKPRWRRGLSI